MSWIKGLFDRDTTPPGEPSVRSVTFSTDGLRVDRRSPDTIEWVDLYRDRAVATLERHTPEWGESSIDVAALRAEHRTQAASRGGGIVSVDILRANGLPVVRTITKHRDRLGSIYRAELIVPLKNARFTLTLSASERGTTGVRDAVVTSFLLSHGLLAVPTGPSDPGARRIAGWFLDPYDTAHDHDAICSLADDERIDQLFEQHPLTKVRRWLGAVVDTLKVDDTVRPVLADGTWAPSDRATRLAERLPARALGVLFLAVDRPDAAERMLLSAIAIDNGEPSEPTTETAGTLLFLGFAREMRGQFAEAEWAFDGSHRMFRSTTGERDIQTARAASNAGRMRVGRGCFEDADPLLREALSIFQEHQSDSDIAVAMNDLGLICQGRHDHRGAVVWFEQAAEHFEGDERRQGRPIPDRARVLNNLGKSLDELGDRKAAAAARARAKAVGATPA